MQHSAYSELVAEMISKKCHQCKGKEDRLTRAGKSLSSQCRSWATTMVQQKYQNYQIGACCFVNHSFNVCLFLVDVRTFECEKQCTSNLLHHLKHLATSKHCPVLSPSFFGSIKVCLCFSLTNVALRRNLGLCLVYFFLPFSSMFSQRL